MASTIILITGANSGIGFATSKVLAQASEKYHIIMAGRSLEKINAAISSLEQTPIKGTLSPLHLDVTSEASIQAAAKEVQERFTRLDVLVNNAAVGGLHLDLAAAFHRCLATNVTGPALVSTALRPLLLASPAPYSIYISSGARTLARNATQRSVGHAHVAGAGGGGGGAYQVSKAALNMLALVEHRDYADQGLKVFVVSPGFVRSNLRGESEEERSGWGMAGDPDGSGELVLRIVRGERDADVGCFVHKDGVYPW